MSEKNEPLQPKQDKGTIPKGNDYFEKGQQGITPPKPQMPSKPNEGGGSNSDGVPGWTPPKN
jgi:hypothetical protein